jgi:hypothetical protein
MTFYPKADDIKTGGEPEGVVRPTSGAYDALRAALRNLSPGEWLHVDCPSEKDAHRIQQWAHGTLDMRVNTRVRGSVVWLQRRP